MASGQAYEAKRVSHFRFSPDEINDLLYIEGVDGKVDEDDALHDPSVNLPIDDDLLANIDAFGVIEAVKVTPRDVKGERRAVVVDGRDRSRHLRKVNEMRIARGDDPYWLDVVNVSGDEKELEDLRIAANTRRPRPPMYRVNEVARLKKKGRPNTELAVNFGVSVSTVENMLALHEAKAKVRHAVERDTIPITAGYRLAKLPLDEQEDGLAELLASTGGARGSARAAQGVKTRRGAGGGGGAAASHPRPKPSILSKLRQAADKDDDVMAILDGCGYNVLRWMIGEVTDRVLPKAIRDVLKDDGA